MKKKFLLINKKIKEFNYLIKSIPGDKSISIRVIMLSSLAIGKSTIKNLPLSEDVQSATKCCKDLGVQIKRKKNITEIYGRGINGFVYKKNLVLNANNSGTVGRTILGAIIRSPYKIKIVGDPSLSKRDFSRIIAPLNEFGATFYPKEKKKLPIYIKGTDFVRPIEWKNPIASAQVNTAIALGALNCPGESIIRSKPCRDHTQKLYKYLKIPIKIKKVKNYDLIKIKGLKNFNSFDYSIPSDPSSAAFFVMLTILSNKSSILIKNCLINKYRIGFYKILKKMGAKIFFKNVKTYKGEKIADIYCKSSKNLKSINLPKNFNNSSAIDEFISIFIISALKTKGISIFKGLEELNKKEAPRLDWGYKILKMIGIKAKKISNHGIKIYGNPKLKLNKKYIIKNYQGDHRIAMNTIILALAKGANFYIHDYDCINTSFPNFLKIIKSIGGKYEIN